VRSAEATRTGRNLVRIQTRHANYRALFLVLEHVARVERGPIHVPDLAWEAGLSRYHLARVFRAALGESIRSFLIRIRLERAAYRLLETNRSVTDLAEEAGYGGLEAFTRAFSRAYGSCPTDYRSAKSCQWLLEAPNDLHWDPERRPIEIAVGGTPPLEMKLLRLPTMRVAALRTIGDYRDLEAGWNHIASLLPEAPWEQLGSRFFSIFHDDFEYSEKSTLRADIGFSVPKSFPIPESLHEVIVPGGIFASTARALTRRESPTVWPEITRHWLPRGGQRPLDVPALDIQCAWPLPFDNVPRRAFVGIELDLGPTRDVAPGQTLRVKSRCSQALSH